MNEEEARATRAAAGIRATPSGRLEEEEEEEEEGTPTH
jgi:hypothetical protein